VPKLEAWTEAELKKTEEYRRHAAACRDLARHAQNGEHRNQLLIMAETWDGLAVERERGIGISKPL
jgi:hypothetical protein